MTLALVLAAAVFSGVAALRAQRVVEVKGFRAAEPFDPPNEAKMKSLLEGASASEDELKDYVRRRLARHKVPREIEFVAELPRTPTGKLKRRELVSDPG